MSSDWRQKLADQFNTLAASARTAEPETKVITGNEFRGIVGSDGIERIEHKIAQPQRCQNCGQITREPHASKDVCIRELRAALRFAQGNIQVIR